MQISPLFFAFTVVSAHVAWLNVHQKRTEEIIHGSVCIDEAVGAQDYMDLRLHMPKKHWWSSNVLLEASFVPAVDPDALNRRCFEFDALPPPKFQLTQNRHFVLKKHRRFWFDKTLAANITAIEMRPRISYSKTIEGSFCFDASDGSPAVADLRLALHLPIKSHARNSSELAHNPKDSKYSAQLAAFAIEPTADPEFPSSYHRHCFAFYARLPQTVKWTGEYQFVLKKHRRFWFDKTLSTSPPFKMVPPGNVVNNRWPEPSPMDQLPAESLCEIFSRLKWDDFIEATRIKSAATLCRRDFRVVARVLVNTDKDSALLKALDFHFNSTQRMPFLKLVLDLALPSAYAIDKVFVDVVMQNITELTSHFYTKHKFPDHVVDVAFLRAVYQSNMEVAEMLFDDVEDETIRQALILSLFPGSAATRIRMISWLRRSMTENGISLDENYEYLFHNLGSSSVRTTLSTERLFTVVEAAVSTRSAPIFMAVLEKMGLHFESLRWNGLLPQIGQTVAAHTASVLVAGGNLELAKILPFFKPVAWVNDMIEWLQSRVQTTPSTSLYDYAGQLNFMQLRKAELETPVVNIVPFQQIQQALVDERQEQEDDGLLRPVRPLTYHCINAASFGAMVACLFLLA